MYHFLTRTRRRVYGDTNYLLQKYWTKGFKYAKSHTKKRWLGKRVKSFDLSARGPGGRKIASMAKTWFWLVVLTAFLKGVSFNRRLLVSWGSLEFWHHSFYLFTSPLVICWKSLWIKDVSTFAQITLFLNTEWEKGGNYHHCAVQCTTEQVLSLITLLGKKREVDEKNRELTVLLGWWLGDFRHQIWRPKSPCQLRLTQGPGVTTLWPDTDHTWGQIWGQEGALEPLVFVRLLFLPMSCVWVSL